MKLNFLIFLSLFSVLAFSQEQLGLRLENYAGASSIFLNPAGNLTNPLPWDFNLIGAGFYLDNNYGFIKNTSTLDLLKNGGSMGFILAKNVDGAFRSDEYVIDFYDDGDKRFFSFNSFVAGPSLVLKVHENHSVGFFTNMRALPPAPSIYPTNSVITNTTTAATSILFSPNLLMGQPGRPGQVS
ncbi:MAG: hypothetical protein R2825_00720 [Saprospiraceae bacterium]